MHCWRFSNDIPGSYSQGKSALWSHLLAFQLECGEIEEAVAPTYSQDTNSLSPAAGIAKQQPETTLITIHIC